MLRRAQGGDPESLSDLATWLEADPRHAIAYAQVQDVWDAFDDHPITPDMLGFRRSVLSKAETTWRRRLAPAGIDRRAVVGAMAATLVAAIAAPLYYFSRSKRQTIVTGVGEQRVAQLSDGSKVTVDANSHLSVDLRPEVRNLRLVSGRAHFEVARDPDRPFHVAADANTVTAIGTAFSVEVRKKRIAVTLFEGRIQVAATDAATRRRHVFDEVKPSQQLVLQRGNAGDPEYRTIDAHQELAWRESQLFFDQAPLDEVADRMNDYSEKKIIVDDKAAAIRISGMYVAGQTDAFVDALEKVYPVRANLTDTGIVLSPRG